MYPMNNMSRRLNRLCWARIVDTLIYNISLEVFKKLAMNIFSHSKNLTTQDYVSRSEKKRDKAYVKA